MSDRRGLHTWCLAERFLEETTGWRISTGNWAFAVSRFFRPLFEDLCVLMMWNWSVFEKYCFSGDSSERCWMLDRNLPTGTDVLPISQGLNVFIPLYNSLYIKYDFPIVYSCNIVVGNKWFGWTGPSADFWNRNSTTSNQEPTGLDWSPNRWLFWGEMGRKARSKSNYPIKDVYTNGESSSFVCVFHLWCSQSHDDE